jgi:glucose-inhibited division protein A
VETNLGLRIRSRSVVVTTGTFMRGLLHVGLQNIAGGRLGDGFSTLSDSLRELGFEVGRFKTGTPCRLNGRTIDFSLCERQDGDLPPRPFTHLPEEIRKGGDEIFTLNEWRDGVFHVEQMSCWSSYTNTTTHDLIRQNRAVMARPDLRPYLGAIACPTLVVAGQNDQLTPPECAYELADGIPGAQLQLLPECGHMLTWEQPQAVTTALVDWLAA